MLASKNEFIKEASETLYTLSKKDNIRLQCEARDDYYRRLRSTQLAMEEDKDTIERQEAEIERQSSEIERQAAIIQQKDSAYNDLLAWAKQHGYQPK